MPSFETYHSVALHVNFPNDERERQLRECGHGLVQRQAGRKLITILSGAGAKDTSDLNRLSSLR